MLLNRTHKIAAVYEQICPRPRILPPFFHTQFPLSAWAMPQSFTNHERDNICFSSAIVVLLVLQQFFNCSFLIQKKVKDRGTSDLLQPTLLLSCQACLFGHTSRVKANGSEPRGRSGRTHWHQCPVDLYACPTITIIFTSYLLKLFHPLMFIYEIQVKQSSASPHQHLLFFLHY